MTALSIVAVLAFVCFKQEHVNNRPESVDPATAEMARQLIQLGEERSVTQRILLSYASVLEYSARPLSGVFTASLIAL
jgi:hypothetical protein